MQKRTNVLIAASGTGGHLFPAVYIAEMFKTKCAELDLYFIGSGRPLEKRILSNKGFEVLTIPTFGVKNLGIKGIAKFILSLPFSIFKTLIIFKKVKPDIVIGVGGYVTVVPVIIAKIMGVPTWVHEAEVKPGMANKLLKHFANKISLAFKEATLSNHKNAVFTGHPVRQELRRITPGIALGHNPRRILVLGGSQGANILDETLPEILSEFTALNIDVRHQCREPNVEKVHAAYEKNNIKAHVEYFIENMPEAYSWADIIVARSGAGTVMEIGVVNRPSVLIPYPHAQGDHQTANAMTLVNAGKALIVKEGDNFNEKLNAALEKILDPSTYFAMKLAKYDSRSLNASERIVDGCLMLLNKK